MQVLKGLHQFSKQRNSNYNPVQSRNTILLPTQKSDYFCHTDRPRIRCLVLQRHHTAFL